LPSFSVAEADFFREPAKRATAESVRRVEAQTSAEIVVAVRRRSGDYRVTAYHFGFALGGLVMLYLLLTPEVFSVPAIAFDAALGFGFGLLLALNVSPLLRLLARERRLERHVQEAARVAFYDLGISRTSGRSGVLVFVSTFERRAVLLGDVGIPVDALGNAWHEASARLSRAVKERDFVAFGHALESLGPILHERLPRAASDVNELPDEVQ